MRSLAVLSVSPDIYARKQQLASANQIIKLQNSFTNGFHLQVSIQERLPKQLS